MATSKFISAFFLTIGFFLLTGSTSKINKYTVHGINSDTVYITSTERLKSNTIPDSVFQMIQLKTLMIFGKDCGETGVHDDNLPNDGIKCWIIKEIPSEIGNLSNLDTLRLTLAAFLKFPKEISNLKKLRFIDLTDSYMSNIDNLTSLKDLNQLWLFGCGLSKLPDNIGNLSNLKFLGLVGNNIDNDEIKRVRKALPNCDVYYH